MGWDLKSRDYSGEYTQYTARKTNMERDGTTCLGLTMIILLGPYH